MHYQKLLGQQLNSRLLYWLGRKRQRHGLIVWDYECGACHDGDDGANEKNTFDRRLQSERGCSLLAASSPETASG